MYIHNVCFHEETVKIIPEISSNAPLYQALGIYMYMYANGKVPDQRILIP